MEEEEAEVPFPPEGDNLFVYTPHFQDNDTHLLPF